MNNDINEHIVYFSPVNLLTSQIPSIVKALYKQLREKSVKTRQVTIVTKPQYQPTNSPHWAPYISLIYQLREFAHRSKRFPFSDYFVNSHNFFSLWYIYIVRRNLMLVILGNSVHLNPFLLQKGFFFSQNVSFQERSLVRRFFMKTPSRCT